MDGLMMIFVLLSVVLSLTPSATAVRCYVCSWSPKDANNRSDVCTSGKLEKNIAYIADCEFGCETFVQWDKNEDLEQWRRNCIQRDTKMTGDCVQDEDRARIWRQCTCDSDYCNGAISWLNTSSLVLLFSLLARALL